MTRRGRESAINSLFQPELHPERQEQVKTEDDLVVRTIQTHAASLLRLARRYSLCADDAHDAYQRALEIFLRRAETLEPARAPAWLATVVKREALAVRQARLRMVGDVDLDAQEARHQPPPDERLLRFEHMTRCAEALQQLKPHEAQALWLQASGRSYAEIARETGWTATKVNRCITEGRRSFLARYASIESGAECDRWAPMVSAMVDGEASREQIAKARPHLRNCPACRALARDARRQASALRAIFPILVVAAPPARPAGETGSLFVRLYEAIAGGLHERAAASVLKAQALLDATSAAKVAAAAASAAALAGGGLAVVDHAVLQRHDRPTAAAARAASRLGRAAAPAPAASAAATAVRARSPGARRAAARRAAAQVESEFSLPGADAPAPAARPQPRADDQATAEFGP
jgi:RNA polymerase sigma factor (sigma-70 family)